MFFSEIARYTRGHLEEHLPGLLTAENAKRTDGLLLTVPVVVDISSVLGTVIGLARDTLPQYALDCTDKSRSESTENLELQLYEGQLQFLVGAADADTAQELARRHISILEKFCKDHAILHQHTDSVGFTITEFDCIHSELMGAMVLNPEGSPDGEFWVGGGSLDLTWTVSESGYSQHGS